MVQNRHPVVAEQIIRGFTIGGDDCLSAVEDTATQLREIGVKIPSWDSLAAGARPQPGSTDLEPSAVHGWQKQTVEAHHREHVWATLYTSRKGVGQG